MRVVAAWAAIRFMSAAISGRFTITDGHFARNQNQNQWLVRWNGYYTLAVGCTSGDGDVTSSVPVMYVPVRVASCHKVQEAMTVPSEEGGTRQVTVTRCQ